MSEDVSIMRTNPMLSIGDGDVGAPSERNRPIGVKARREADECYLVALIHRLRSICEEGGPRKDSRWQHSQAKIWVSCRSSRNMAATSAAISSPMPGAGHSNSGSPPP